MLLNLKQPLVNKYKNKYFSFETIMIYLNETIYIPNLMGVDSSNYRLVLHNNVTNEEFILDVSNDSDNELYYSFVLDTSSMSQNEYTIYLYDASTQYLGKFLAQKGIRSEVKRTSFENDTKYIQFEL